MKPEIIRRAFASIEQMCAVEQNKRRVRERLADALAAGEWLGSCA